MLAGSWATIVVFMLLAHPLLLARFGPEALLAPYAVVSLMTGLTTYILLRRAGTYLKNYRESVPSSDESGDSQTDSDGGNVLDESLVETEIEHLRKK